MQIAVGTVFAKHSTVNCGKRFTLAEPALIIAAQVAGENLTPSVR